MHTTNYASSFIRVSPDTSADHSRVPPKPESIAGLQHALLSAEPYRWTSDDLLFEIFARRNGIPAAERATARAAYFSKGQPCLRSSPLVKQYGWGLRYDDQGRIALCAVESTEYDSFVEDPSLIILSGMRSSRG